MLMESAAPAYHWSALNTLRLIRFFDREFAVRDRDAGFLPFPGFDVLRLDIDTPVTALAPMNAS
jgi:hypothetical protein